jgi:hypothetical protein
MTQIRETDAMDCRACGRQERASEGYPCTTCGTFICLICTFQGVTQCAKCRGVPIPVSPVPPAASA